MKTYHKAVKLIHRLEENICVTYNKGLRSGIYKDYLYIIKKNIS